AHYTTNRLALETALLDRFDLLSHRADRIRDHFADLERLPEDPKPTGAANLELVAAKRIREGLDRYDRPVLAPRGTNSSAVAMSKLMDMSLIGMTAAERELASVIAFFPNNMVGWQLRQATLGNVGAFGSRWATGVVNGYQVIALSQVPEGLRDTSLR